MSVGHHSTIFKKKKSQRFRVLRLIFRKIKKKKNYSDNTWHKVEIACEKKENVTEQAEFSQELF